MHKFSLGIIAGCFFTIFHLLPGSLAAQEVCPIPTTSGNATYQPDWRLQLQWAPDNPQEIARNQSVTLHVINGTAPYKWSVAEPGFSLASNDTADETNTLTANNTACGSATITVTDSAGNSVAGYVRCTTGQWVLVAYIYYPWNSLDMTPPITMGDYANCHGVTPGVMFSEGGGWYYYSINGKYKVQEAFGNRYPFSCTTNLRYNCDNPANNGYPNWRQPMCIGGKCSVIIDGVEQGLYCNYLYERNIYEWGCR